ncbi:hypothetical protein KSD_59380 [Ktedonobacter sp. SOSP1-85]|uniref:sigma-70 family RNA polymerase sigma factor n=1 Tax=Ktedonobacter sp. SOSP1-85 TaxID=2778367 RepID=UPI001915EC53|nr:sigma-70 family RNA polymerase sigma factor [Ktedonobacter sp. SOSP1-85]GHO78167.1 hypothetical protein KSD_59380 [Ktedonobacter sp. SOSP1-85]
MPHQDKNTSPIDHDQLFDRYNSLIFAYLRSYTISLEDAEDLTLETFITALESIDIITWEGPRQLAWLRRVAHNKLMERYRHLQRHPILALDHLTDIIPDSPHPEQIVLRNEEQAQLWLYIQRLPLLQQRLLLLRYGYGLPTLEIATLLQKSDQAIRKLLSRTICSLRIMYAHSLVEKEERS